MKVKCADITDPYRSQARQIIIKIKIVATNKIILFEISTCFPNFRAEKKNFDVFKSPAAMSWNWWNITKTTRGVVIKITGESSNIFFNNYALNLNYYLNYYSKKIFSPKYN